MLVTAIYPGTFDPITHGHTDLIIRGAGLFSQLVVAIADSPNKKPRFDLAERVRLAESVISDTGLSNVTVIGFSALLVDVAEAQGATVILRGVRTSSDFDFEYPLAGMNRQLSPGIDTVFLTPSAEYCHISSTLVREIAALGGDVSQFVAPSVVKAFSVLA